MAGYTRQSAADIVPGAQIDAEPLDDEFDAIDAAFDETTGHAHDGTIGGGAPINVAHISGIGDLASMDNITLSLVTDAGDLAALDTITLSLITDAGDLAALDTVDTAQIANNAVTNDKIRDSAALSVIGNPTNSTAGPQDITASTDGHVLRRSGTSIGFGTIAHTVVTGLGSIATQAADNVNITGGSITGITDLAVADGGTGAGTAAGARANLGLVIGTDVQAYDATLAAIAGLSPTANQAIYFTGADTASTFTISSFGRSLVDDGDAGTARTTLGLGSLATQSNINNTNWSGDDLSLANGGTGASLSDPNADRIMFWDDSAGSVTWLVPNTGISISGTNLNVTSATDSAAGIIEVATVTEWRGDASGSLALTPEVVWDSMAEVSLTDASSISWNMASGFDFTVTLGGNRTLSNPTNAKVGQKGRLKVVQGGAGGRTLTWSSNYEFAGGTAPTLSTGAGANDVFYYDVISSTRILISTGGLDIS